MSKGKRHNKGVLVLLVTLVVILVIGCGGGGGGGGGSLSTTGTTTATTGGTTGTTGTTSGNVSLTFQWPTEAPTSRSIPSYAASIVLTIYTTGTTNVVFAETFDRNQAFPYNQVVTVNLPAGKYTIHLDAKPFAGGHGDTLASAVLPITVTDGENATVGFTITSLVATIFIDDLPAQAAVGDSVQLSAHAEDKSGNAILLPQNALNWSITSGNSFASVTTGGLFKVIAPGTVTLQATEVDSGATTTKQLSLSAGPSNGVIIIVS